MISLVEQPDRTRHWYTVFAGSGALIGTGELITKRQSSSLKDGRLLENGQ